jgi:hypothetical protein
MRLLQYTIIIWMSFAGASEGGSLEGPSFDDPVEPSGSRVRPKPPIRPSYEISFPPHREPVQEPVRNPIVDPVGKKPSVIYSNPIHVEGLPTVSLLEEGGIPSTIPSSVQAYLTQHASLPTVLESVVLPKGTTQTIAQIRAQYLTAMQESFDKEGIIKVPSVALTSSISSFIQTGVTSPLVQWVLSVTDGISFAEHLAQSPTATNAQRDQFVLSTEKKFAYETAKASLVASAQKILTLVADLHQQYTGLLVMGKRSRDFTLQEMEGLSGTVDAITQVLKTSIQQRRTLIASLCAESSLYAQEMLAAVVDQAPGLEAWKAQEKFEDKNTLIFPSYEQFIKEFNGAVDTQVVVQRYIGLGKGQFSSVQALVTALDQIGFILESKNYWLSFVRSQYSKKMVDDVLLQITKMYPDVYIPSKKFILKYCAMHRSFKPVSFFIPNFGEFLIDARTLTIEELAKKYGQRPEFVQSLLNNAYEAMYVLQQTNQNRQASQLNAVIQQILLEYPTLDPSVVAEVITAENVAVRALLNTEIEGIQIASGLRKELVTLQAGQFQKELSQVATQLSNVQTFIGNALSRLESLVTDKATDGIASVVKNTSLGKTVERILEQLQQAENSLAIVQKIKGNIPASSDFAEARYQEVQEQLTSLKQDTMKFAVEAEYEKAKAQQDKLSLGLVEILHEALKRELLSYTKNYWTHILGEITNSLEQHISSMTPTSLPEGGDDTEELINELALKSALEKQNEWDYQACIWASNKMGMMESKISCISALLKIKRTALFLAGYKNMLKDLEADFLFLSSSKSVQKCLNVIARRSFLLDKIKILEKEIKALQKEIDEEQKSPVAE